VIARDLIPKFHNENSSKLIVSARSDVSSLLKFEEYVTVVEQAFALHAAGKTAKPGLLHMELPEGEFHIKAGDLKLRKQYFALKVYGGLFYNAERFGMPNIQGVIVLFDGDNLTEITDIPWR
jgi:alanine dehydrogenase